MITHAQMDGRMDIQKTECIQHPSSGGRGIKMSVPEPHWLTE